MDKLAKFIDYVTAEFQEQENYMNKNPERYRNFNSHIVLDIEEIDDILGTNLSEVELEMSKERRRRTRSEEDRAMEAAEQTY